MALLCAAVGSAKITLHCQLFIHRATSARMMLHVHNELVYLEQYYPELTKQLSNSNQLNWLSLCVFPDHWGLL